MKKPRTRKGRTALKRPFTTTLPASLRYQLAEAAKELQVPKRRIICEALVFWLSKEYPKIRFTEEFMRAAENGDPLPDGRILIE